MEFIGDVCVGELTSRGLWSPRNVPGWLVQPIDEYFVKYAKEIGLDVDQFKKDVEEKKFEKKIQQDISDANAIGVSATPTFYINGEEQVGGLPYDEFKKKIDAALKAS